MTSSLGEPAAFIFSVGGCPQSVESPPGVLVTFLPDRLQN